MTWFRDYMERIPNSIGWFFGGFVPYLAISNALTAITLQGVDDLEGVISDAGRGAAAYLTFSNKSKGWLGLYNWAPVVASFIPKFYQFADRASHAFGVNADAPATDLVYHAIWVSLMIGAGLVGRQLDLRADERAAEQRNQQRRQRRRTP